MSPLDQLFQRRLSVLSLFSALFLFAGCTDDNAEVRAIKARRQDRLQSQVVQDHTAEMYNLLSKLVELNREAADRQIVYHLNQWQDAHGDKVESGEVADLAKTISDVLPPEQKKKRIEQSRFVASDIDHLRDCYLFSQIIKWVDTDKNDDPLLQDWLAETTKKLSTENADKLRTACRLFDWTMRNVAFEPDELPGGPPSPKMPFGLKINGIGYRQSDYQAVWRGTGDWLQRGGVFTQLCRQASVDAAILATQTDTGELKPWSVGVLIDKEVYLFDPALATYVPGPDQVGIATLSQARKDSSVTRRLGVAGFDQFQPPVQKQEIQQCTALLNLAPEAISPRMQRLEGGLTGDRRMSLFVDADAKAEQWDNAPGIAGARIWKMPIYSEVYADTMAKQSELDPRFAIWHLMRWAILDSADGTAQQLSKARWQHLHGKFADVEDNGELGARTLYLGQRAPEFEIQDLLIDVDLQRKYFRRDLGLDPAQYRQQLTQVQGMMRMGKRTATYWLSLVQFDDGRVETADNWFKKRVLDENQMSFWQPAARYNMGRAAELLGEPERAIEIYKTDGDPQEHGNRIRARLVAKAMKK